MATDLTSNCIMLRRTPKTVEEIKDLQGKRNELPGIHRPNRPRLC